MFSLDTQQKVAVSHHGSNLLILAGAGSGKTKTLVERAISTLDEAGDKYVLLVTFTKKAAHEIKERIHSSNSTHRVHHKLWIGTFHSLCWTLLRQAVTCSNVDKYRSILDPRDSERVFSIAARAYGVNDPKVVTAMRSFYSFHVNSLLTLEGTAGSLCCHTYNWDIALARKVISKYEALCKKSGRVDFDNIQKLFLDVLDNADTAACYRDKIHHIFVDEFQDTNNIQCEILSRLHSNNLTVVGDDFQSIYGFRAANVENIVTFEARFAAKKVVLENNYRSSNEIVKLANLSIRNNKNQLFKTCRSVRESCHKPRLIIASTPAEEANCVGLTIKSIFEKSQALPSVAVLCRATKQAALLQNELTKSGISYQLVGGIDFFAEDHIKIILDYLRLIVNPFDAISLLSLNNLLGLAPQKLMDEIEMRADTSHTDFWFEASMAASPYREKLLKFKEEVDDHRHQYRKGYAIKSILFAIIKSIKGQLLDRLTVSANEFDQDISIFLELAGQFKEIEDVLESLALNEIVETREQSDALVTISTIHSAKGLEWDHVFVVGLVESWFPLKMALASRGDDEEERRLFYVAVTRAVQNLYLTSYLTSPSAQGREFKQEISRFVSEIPSEALQRFRAPPLDVETRNKEILRL